MSFTAIVIGHAVMLMTVTAVLFLLKDNPKSLPYFEYQKMVFYGLFLLYLFMTPIFMALPSVVIDITSTSLLFVTYILVNGFLFLLMITLFALHLTFDVFKKGGNKE